MALPDVIIDIVNGALGGILRTQDGVVGLVLNGATEGDMTAGSPFYVNSFAAFQTMGITVTNNPFAFKQVKEFYDCAGDGAPLYLNIVPNTMTVALMADITTVNGAKALLDFAGGRIRLLGVINDPTQFTPTITAGLDVNVQTAITKLQALAVAYKAKNTPFWGFVGGTSFSGTATALTDQTQSTTNMVSCLIGDTESGDSAALGVLLGTLAILPVQRKASRVKNGSLPITAAYIKTTTVDKYTQLAEIHNRGYITLRQFTNLNGFFFSSTQMCCRTDDDFQNGVNWRVIMKAILLTYAVYVIEVDEEVPVNADGTIDAGYGTYIEGRITNQVELNMKANREISGFRASVDLSQNIISTSELKIVEKVTPVGYASTIRVSLGLENPAL